MHYLDISLEGFTNAKKDAPPILDLLNPEYSLLVACLQVWSTMVGSPSTCDRLCLIWRHRGCDSFREWYFEHRDDVRLVRRGALALIAATERRQLQHGQVLDKWQ